MKTLSLNAKIVSIMAILITGGLAIAIAAQVRLADIQSTVDTITHTIVPRMTAATNVRAAFRNITMVEKNYILATDKEEATRFQAELDAAHERFKKVMAEAVAIGSQQGKEKLKEIELDYNNWVTNHEAVIALAREGKTKEAVELNLRRGTKTQKAIEEKVTFLVDLNNQRMKDQEDIAMHDYESARNMMIILSILALSSGAIAAYFVMRSVNNAINAVIRNLQDSSDQVSSAAQQISASSESLSQSATEQAASLEETAASIEEISSMVNRNAESSKKAADLAASSHESASKGKEVVQNMIVAIQEINTSNNEIADIVKVISEIGNKTKVINDIVFQTKLLWFNASVEAARAGEHGKGFAVVAEEVGNLAQMSGNAAKEISTMLDSSIQRVERLVATSRDKVEVGTRVAGECGEVLDEIVHSVGSVTTMASEIAKASDEQSRGIGEITRAMAQLDQVTQQNAAGSEQTASSAEELSAQSESLRGVVRELVVAIKGGRASNPSAANQDDNSSSGKGEKGNRKVIHIKNSTAKKGLRLHTNNQFSSPQPEAPARRASGLEGVPSGNDPRFEEV